MDKLGNSLSKTNPGSTNKSLGLGNSPTSGKLPINLSELQILDDKERAIDGLNKLEISKISNLIDYLNLLASLNLFKNPLKQEPYFKLFNELMFGCKENSFDPTLRLSQIVTAISNTLIKEKLIVADDIKRLYFFQNSFYYQVEKKGSIVEPIESLRRSLGLLHLQMEQIFDEIKSLISSTTFIDKQLIRTTSFNLTTGKMQELNANTFNSSTSINLFPTSSVSTGPDSSAIQLRTLKGSWNPATSSSERKGGISLSLNSNLTSMSGGLIPSFGLPSGLSGSLSNTLNISLNSSMNSEGVGNWTPHISGSQNPIDLSNWTDGSKDHLSRKFTEILQYYRLRWNIFKETNMVTIQSQVYKLLVSHVNDLTIIPHLVSGCKVGGIPFADRYFLIEKANWVSYDILNAPVKNNMMMSMEFTQEEFNRVISQLFPPGYNINENCDYSKESQRESWLALMEFWIKESRICQIVLTISNHDLLLYQIFLLILANAMVGKVSKTLYTFYSPWNNSGKTTLENIYSRILGSYCYWATPNIFKNNNSSHQMDRKNACDKRIIIVDDAKNSSKDSPEEIKALTAGANAKISCRGAYDKGVCSYPITFTLIKSCNDLDAVSSREFILLFPCLFTSWSYAEGCSDECLLTNSVLHQRRHRGTQPQIDPKLLNYTLPYFLYGGKNRSENKPVYRPKMEQEEFHSIINDREELLKFIVILSYFGYITNEEDTLEKLKEQYRKKFQTF